MKLKLLVLFSLCAFSAAMIPRDRRAVDTDTQKPPEVTTKKQGEICAYQTPCGWTIYKANVKIVDQVIKNTYCTCDAGFVCEITEDDAIMGIHKCRPPSEDNEHIIES